jgi:hypothetical protein
MSLLGLRSSGQDAACFTSRAVSLSRALLLGSLLLSKRSGAAEADLDPLSSSPEPEGRLLIETLIQTRSHPDLNSDSEGEAAGIERRESQRVGRPGRE